MWSSDQLRKELVDKTLPTGLGPKPYKHYSHSELYLPLNVEHSTVLDRWPSVGTSVFTDPSCPPTLTETTAYVGFTPADLPADTFLGFLRWGLSTPVQRTISCNGMSTWIIEPATLALIKDMDQLFRSTLQAIRQADPSNFLVTSQIAWRRCPTAYLQAENYATKEAASQAVNNARMAFLPLFALLSYTIVRYPTGNRIPKWVEILGDRGFKKEWIDGLSKSSLLNFSGSIRRIGAFISLSNGILANTYYLYFKCRIPVWFKIDDNHAAWMKTAIHREAEFDIDIKWLKSSSLKSLVDLVLDYPIIDRASGHLMKETPAQFRKRQEAEKANRAVLLVLPTNWEDTPFERGQRVARQRQYDTVGIKDFTGRVFVWELFDVGGDESLVWLRRRVSLRDLPRLWYQHGRNNCTFNAHTNEIDVKIPGANNYRDRDEFHGEDQPRGFQVC